MNLEEIKYSVVSLQHRKTRSFLTILSILIGITAVFALMSFGLGIQAYVDNLAAEAGADKLIILAKGIGAPGTDASFYLSPQDINFVEKRKGVKDIAGVYFSASKIERKGELRYNYLIGMPPEKREFLEAANTLKIYKGRGLKKGDEDKVVLGYNYQLNDKVFEKPVSLGDKLLVEGASFEVIGFYKEIGSPVDDAQIYITDKAFEAMYPDKKDKFGYIMLQAEKNIDPEALAKELTAKLRRFRGQEEGKEDFYVQTFADLLETYGTIIGLLNNVLLLIALVSLIVAGVNIMNTMYTAVLERTKEIGIMKAIGARNSKILSIFVFESGFLGFVGGLFGIFLGYLVASAGGAIADASGYSALQPIFPLWLIIGCMVFAFSIGLISGLLPSIQASKLKPVDALRYE